MTFLSYFSQKKAFFIRFLSYFNEMIWLIYHSIKGTAYLLWNFLECENLEFCGFLVFF